MSGSQSSRRSTKFFKKCGENNGYHTNIFHKKSWQFTDINRKGSVVIHVHVQKGHGLKTFAKLQCSKKVIFFILFNVTTRSVNVRNKLCTKQWRENKC